MDSRRAPQGVRGGHTEDQGLDLRVNLRATSARAAREPGLVLAEATALPSQDSVGRHDDKSLPPAGPDAGQPDPQQTIHGAELRPGHRTLVDGELLAQGEVFEGELAMTAEEEREKPEDV